MTRIFKSMSWSRRPASFIFQKEIFQPGQERYQFHCQNPGTKCPPGEIPEDVKTTEGAAHHVLSVPNTIWIWSYSVAQTPLVSPPPGSVDVPSGINRLEISRSVLHCTMAWRVSSSLWTTGLSPFLGPYFKLHQGFSGVAKERSTALQRRHAKTEYRNHNDVWSFYLANSQTHNNMAMLFRR